MRIIYRLEELYGKALQQRIRYRVIWKPLFERLQTLAHDLEHKTNMAPIRALMLKAVFEPGNVLSSYVPWVRFCEVLQYLELKDVLFAAVALGATDFHGSERDLFAESNVSWCVKTNVCG